VTKTLTPGAGDEPEWPAGWRETRDAERQDRFQSRVSSVQVPSVGRIVHFSSHTDPACRAAMIAAVGDDTVTLTVFNPLPDTVIKSCQYNSGRVPGSWHWPERV
jgi:hypothetical protein